MLGQRRSIACSVIMSAGLAVQELDRLAAEIRAAHDETRANARWTVEARGGPGYVRIGSPGDQGLRHGAWRTYPSSFRKEAITKNAESIGKGLGAEKRSWSG